MNYVVPLLLEVREVAAIQVRVDPVGPDLKDLLPYFKKIQERKPLIVGGSFISRDIDWLSDNLQPGWLEIIAEESPIRDYLKGK